MKKKVLIVAVAILLLSQVPFAYRRYRLTRLQNTIQQLSSQRVSTQSESEFADYRGVIHVHSFLGGHSTGTFSELIEAARANSLDFVIMTEHPQMEFDTSVMTLSGVHGGVLFINGNEVATASGDRLLLIPGSENAASASSVSTQEVIARQKSAGGLAFAAYPAESQTWESNPVDGVEVYNLFTNARQTSALITFFDGIWSYGSYADFMFANFFARPAENLRRWDDAIFRSKRKLVAIAGNDAHSNIGLSLNDASGRQRLGIKLDPYERSFRVVRTHVLIRKDKPLTRESLLEAISQGHCYVSFDLFSDPKGFSVTSDDPERRIIGDEIASPDAIRLTASAPLTCRFVLIKDGNVIEQRSGTAAQFSTNGSGSYRIEAYLDSLPAPAQGQPWIISNPIYIK